MVIVSQDAEKYIVNQFMLGVSKFADADNYALMMATTTTGTKKEVEDSAKFLGVYATKEEAEEEKWRIYDAYNNKVNFLEVR